MVKMTKYVYPLLLVMFLGAAFFTGCNHHIQGFFAATDLDIRLKEKNNFTFLNRDNAPPLSLTDEYAFLIVADTHIYNGKTWGLENLKNVIDNNVKFIVVIGDITHRGSARDLRKFIAIADSFAVPVYPVIGNHDIDFGWSEWKNLIGSSKYRIDGDGTTLFFLDSANAFLGRDQLNWLQRELKTARERVFVFSQANIFVEHPLNAQQLTCTKERARLTSILRNRADAMFMGHVHRRILRDVGGVRYITIEDFRNHRTYLRVSVTKTGITYTFGSL